MVGPAAALWWCRAVAAMARRGFPSSAAMKKKNRGPSHPSPSCRRDAAPGHHPHRSPAPAHFLRRAATVAVGVPPRPPGAAPPPTNADMGEASPPTKAWSSGVPPPPPPPPGGADASVGAVPLAPASPPSPRTLPPPAPAAQSPLGSPPATTPSNAAIPPRRCFRPPCVTWCVTAAPCSSAARSPPPMTRSADDAAPARPPAPRPAASPSLCPSSSWSPAGSGCDDPPTSSALMPSFIMMASTCHGTSRFGDIHAILNEARRHSHAAEAPGRRQARRHGRRAAWLTSEISLGLPRRLNSTEGRAAGASGLGAARCGGGAAAPAPAPDAHAADLRIASAQEGGQRGVRGREPASATHLAPRVPPHRYLCPPAP